MKNIALFSIAYLLLLAAICQLAAPELLAGSQTVALSFFGFEFTRELPRSWVFFGPLLLFAAGAIALTAGGNFAAWARCRRRAKDVRNFSATMAAFVLGSREKLGFKSEEFAQIAPQLCSLASGQAASTLSEPNDALSAALRTRAAILRGEYVDARLAKKSALAAKNYENLCASDLAAASAELRGKSEASSPAEQLALGCLLARADYERIKRTQIARTPADNEALLARVALGDLAMSASELQVFLSNSGFSEAQFLAAAKRLAGAQIYEPAALLAVFKSAAGEHEAAARAHYYLLAHSGCWDELRELLHRAESTQADFEALLYLKDGGKTYELERIIG